MIVGFGDFLCGGCGGIREVGRGEGSRVGSSIFGFRILISDGVGFLVGVCI